MSIVVEQSATRRCTRCCCEKPIIAFRRRSRESDARHPECSECKNARERRLAATKRRQGIDLAVREANEIARKRGRFVAFVDELLDRHGGIDRLGQGMTEAFHAARAAGRHHVVLRHYRLMLHLLRAAEDLAPEPDEFTDEDIRAYERQGLIELIEQDPTIVFEVAGQLGYTVIPPQSPAPNQELNPQEAP